MAKLILRDQKVWMGGFDLSGAMSSLALDYGSEAVDIAALGDKTRIMQAGLRTVAAQHEGIWETDDGLDTELFARVGLGDAPMSISVPAAAEGDIAFSFRALLADYTPGAEIGEALRFSLAAQSGSGDGLVRGTLMHNAVRTTSANGTARQLGAAAAGQKLYGALHVIAAGGTTPTLDITVESDDAVGFPSPTLRMTFAQQTAVGFEWATPIAGPIADDWWRVVWAIGGAGPSFTFVVTLAIQ